jgi:cysteine desulfurase / selenocysteine lyase
MTPATAAARTDFDVAAIRNEFPILRRHVHGRPLVYLDNAATTQKPQVVIDRLVRYYSVENANIHRGVHVLSVEATDAYEEAREQVRRFINAAGAREVIFVRGATEAINLVAATYGRAHIGAGDEVVISEMEHHSNIVPWQMLCEEKGARLRVVPITDAGELRLDEYERALGARTRLVSVAHVSNALGTINPVEDVVALAHDRGIPVLIDGAQAVAHMSVDVEALGCDFYVFSGHKVFGPTGIGVLYGREELLESMPPYQGGGDMIRSVTFERTLYNELPNKFEAGTPNIAGAIGLGAAIQYLTKVGLESTAAHEHDLLAYGTETLLDIPGLRLTGTAPRKAGILSFMMDDVHPHDIGTILDRDGVAIRAGHHCCQPLMARLGVPATARASLALYNTRDDIDALAASLRSVGRCSGEWRTFRAAGAVSGGDPRPQPPAEELPRTRRRSRGEGRQPIVRRSADGVRASRERRRGRRRFSRIGLRHLESVSVVDDRGRQGQEGRGGSRVHRPIPPDDHGCRQ